MRQALAALLVVALSACGKPASISVIKVYVLADRTVKVDGKLYSNIPDAKAAVKQIESERPDTRFTVSVTNMSEPDAMDLVQKLSDGDGKMGLVGILTEPHPIN